MVSLRVTVFDNWTVNSPVWVAPGYLSQSQSAIRNWQQVRPAAITLKTTGDVIRRAPARGIGRIKVRISGRAQSNFEKELPDLASLYCNGEPRYEFMSSDGAAELAAYAAGALCDTKVGISAMMGEDYSCIARKTAHHAAFAELNLKFAARILDKPAVVSLAEVATKNVREVLDHVFAFSDAFKGVPIFIKLTREFTWLRVCAECSEFLGAIHSLLERRDIGLIVANTRQTRMPPDLLPLSAQDTCDELSPGIIAGQYLYIDTYDIIRTLRDSYREHDAIPIIATGGVMTLPSIVEVLRAGAVALQMYTAFDINGLSYYTVLNEALRNVVEQSGCGEFDQFLAMLRKADRSSLARIRQLARSLAASA